MSDFLKQFENVAQSGDEGWLVEYKCIQPPKPGKPEQWTFTLKTPDNKVLCTLRGGLEMSSTARLMAAAPKLLRMLKGA